MQVPNLIIIIRTLFEVGDVSGGQSNSDLVERGGDSGLLNALLQCGSHYYIGLCSLRIERERINKQQIEEVAARP